MPIITLTTDFGLDDGYVAAMKGVILCRAPGATIVDLCHAIRPQAIDQAALLLTETCLLFPTGTIHVAVVDPGVGSDRAIIALAAHGHLFVAPDNGVLGGLLTPEAKAYAAQRPDLYRQPVSPTFHGRDIIAPLAAHLAAGHEPAALGEEVPVTDLVPLPAPRPTVDLVGRRIGGAVQRIDHFGNLITNIGRADLDQLPAASSPICLTIGAHTLSTWCDHYSQVLPGQPLILIASNGMVEVAVNQGHAASRLGVGIYTPVTLSIC